MSRPSWRVRAADRLARAADPLRRLGLRRLVRAGRSLTRLMGPLTVETEGIRLSGGVEHRGLLGAVASGTFEPGTQTRFRAAIRPGGTVLDVGANIGVYALSAASVVGSSGRVIAVEPDPRNLRWLRRNVALNGLQDRVEIVDAALGASPGSATLSLDEADPTQSTLVGPANHANAATVRVVTGAQLIHGTVDVVKVDVEGFELEVLEGLAPVLSSSPEAVVLCELNPRTLGRNGRQASDLLGALDGLGFRVRAVDERSGNLMPVPDAASIEYFVTLFCDRPATAR